MIKSSDLRDILRRGNWFDDAFHILSSISRISFEDPSVGRELVIRALERREDLPVDLRGILNELAVRVGLHPYVSELEALSLRSALSHAAHRADGEMDDFVLHSAQAKVLRKLVSGRSVILSAPTSFGKSLLIDVVISARDFVNVVLIVPTLALVEETRRRMSRFVDRYSIVTATGQSLGERNIFVLTQERFLAMKRDIPSVDFFVIDEFYKLSISGEGDRATQLNQAFLALIKTGAQFYLLGPSIREIPKHVTERFDCSFIVEDFQTVAIELHLKEKRPNREEALARLLDEVDGQTLVYCQSPPSTRKVLRDYLSRRAIAPVDDPELVEAANWTAENYHDKWLVSVALRHGVGVHHGRLPRSLGRFMIRAFEEGKIKILLCTSTLIEGVNTAAKNVIVYDSKLNRKSLDFFTFNNIRGRSGRMFRHFVGNVYLFDPPPQEELPFVDMPALNPTDETPMSILLQLSGDEVPSELKEKVLKVSNQKHISLEVLKRNSGIEPEFIIEAAKHLNSLGAHNISLFSWTARPQYENVLAASEVIWYQLGGAASARQGAMRTPAMMTKWIWDLYRTRNVPKFRREKIENQISRGDSPDDAVENVLAFLRGWASFNYPKYLSALNDVASEVLSRRGLVGCNYIPFAASIEHLFQPTIYASLEEYGLPTEISEKLVKGRVFSGDDGLESVVKSLRSRELSAFANGIFERRVVEDFQQGIGARRKEKP